MDVETMMCLREEAGDGLWVPLRALHQRNIWTAQGCQKESAVLVLRTKSPGPKSAAIGEKAALSH